MLPNLSYPLIDPDETRYAQIALEMNHTQDWITPKLHGTPYLDKPPLMYWLTAGSFAVFGNNQAAARLPSVFSAIAMVLLTFGIGRRLVGPRAALIGSFSLLLCGGFVLAGRFLVLDSLLAFFVTACSLTGYIAVREGNHRWSWWMVSGIACALGVLTKGPVALVLCAPPLVVCGWLRRDETRVPLIHWIAFVVPMILVCVPWYVAVWKLNAEFGDHFFWEHNLKRFTQGSNHEQPFWFYFPTLFAAMFPVSLLLPSLGVFLVGRSEIARRLRTKDLGFLFCSSVWILLFFSLASCKLPTYILPAIPVICLMMGAMLDKTVFQPEVVNRITTFLKPFPQRATLILVASGFTIIAADAWYCGTLETSTIIASLVGFGMIGITIYAWNRPIAFSQTGWVFTAVFAVMLLSFTAGRFIPTIATTRSVYARTAALSEQNPGKAIVFYGENSHASQLLLSQPEVVQFSREMKDEFVDFVARHPQVILVTSHKEINDTREIVSRTHEIVSTGVNPKIYLTRPIASPESQVSDLTDRELR